MSSMPTPAARPLIGALVRRPTEAVHLRILREAHEAGFTDLVPAHLAVLRYPGPNGRRPSELAAEVGTTKQAMNYLLGQLEQLDYLRRGDDLDDQRSKRVQLTKRGEALRRVIRRSVARIEADLETELGAASYTQLRELLVRLNDTDTIKAERNTP
jgi:DNA-binding MarR family transcriptional regulator